MNTAILTELNLDNCDVVNLRATEPHQLVMRFRDGLVAELDFAAFIATAAGSVVEPLRDAAYFARVTLDEGVLKWPNGYDIDPVKLRTWAERGYCD